MPTLQPFMNKVLLRRKISNRVPAGHPWIFGNELAELDDSLAPGEIVEVYTYDKKFIGKGYYNPKSQIVVRILTRDKQENIDDQFFL